MSHAHHGPHAAGGRSRTSLLVAGVRPLHGGVAVLLHQWRRRPNRPYYCLAGLTINSPWVLLIPLIALFNTQLAVVRSLRPVAATVRPQNGAQPAAGCAPRLMAVMAGMAAARRRHGLAGIGDSASAAACSTPCTTGGATKPRRSLPLPGSQAPVAGDSVALAVALYRRSGGFTLVAALLAWWLCWPRTAAGPY